MERKHTLFVLGNALVVALDFVGTHASTGLGMPAVLLITAVAAAVLHGVALMRRAQGSRRVVIFIGRAVVTTLTGAVVWFVLLLAAAMVMSSSSMVILALLWAPLLGACSSGWMAALELGWFAPPAPQ